MQLLKLLPPGICDRIRIMRIGIDVSQIVYGTGVSNYTKKLVENLLKIDRKNQYVIFGSSLRQKGKLNQFKKSLEGFENAEFKFISLPPLILEFLWNRLHVFPIEKFIGEVNIFHSSDWTQPPIKTPSTKKVTTIHDMVPYLFPSSVHKKILGVQKRRLSRVQKEADMIIADSETTKDDLVKFLNITPKKVRVIYLAASEEFRPQSDDKIREVLEKYKIKKPYLLSVATQEPRKNIQKILDVFAQVVNEKPEFRLVLTGKYGWGPGLRSAENVVWTGYIPQEDLIALYAGCRVFVYPSLYEGFGLPILEAMSLGAPVVTSNISSMPEVAGDAAILVDPHRHEEIAEGLLAILNNPVLARDLRTKGLQRAKLFSWKRAAGQTLDVLESVV